MAPSAETRKRSRTVRPVLAFAVLLGALSCGALRAQPREEGDFRTPDLLEIVRLDSTIRLDVRYATSRNFMKRPMYAEARAFLQRPAAEALVRVHRALRARGFGLLVFDAYRPWSVTKKFWDETPPALRNFVANPSKGSRHNRGCAVDCTLYGLKDGKEVPMPSAYDEFSRRASPRYGGGSAAARGMRALLRGAMEAEGFTVDRGEWWHYDFKEWSRYRILDVPFSSLR
jgi:D-alanyl-D-alanine dipeptidase